MDQKIAEQHESASDGKPEYSAELNELIQKHNESQQATVGRAQDLVKMLLLTSGGALAVCANFFSAKVNIPSQAVVPIQFAWATLSIAIVLFGVALLLMLARDYFFGEIQGAIIEAALHKIDSEDKPMSPNWDLWIWAPGLLGFVAFIIGLGCFTLSACLFLSASN